MCEAFTISYAASEEWLEEPLTLLIPSRYQNLK